MKKVLIVMTSLYNGGAEKSLVNFINELPEDKYEIDLLLFKRYGMFLSQIPNYVNILKTPTNLKKLYGKLSDAQNLLPTKLFGTAISHILTKNISEKKGYRWKYFYSKKIDRVEKNYDVAIAYISGEILYFVDEKVNAKKKIVWVHNDYKTAKYSKNYDYEYFSKMNAIVSISEHCVNILKKEFPKFKSKIYCVKNITSSHVVKDRANEFKPKEFDYSVSRILSIGRLNEQKGFDMAIQAAALMKAKGLKFKWYIIGNGELKKSLEKQIREKNVSEYFILLGPRENPYVYIKNCSIFVQPSRYEGKSVVLDEVKILAKPIVTTNYPTIRDQLSDDEGLVVDMTPEGIAQGIIEMLDENRKKTYSKYLSEREYGNQKDINLYYKVIDS